VTASASAFRGAVVNPRSSAVAVIVTDPVGVVVPACPGPRLFAAVVVPAFPAADSGLPDLDPGS